MENSCRSAPDEVFEALTAWQYRWGMHLYRAGISAFFAAGGLRRLKKKYKAGIEERMGIFGPDVPSNALWVHSVSVGEVQSALPLLRAAETMPDLPRILSTVTATGRALAEQITQSSVSGSFISLIYNTWDNPRFVKRALDTLKPRAYVAMETERWPAVLAELKARGIPAFLVNGRLSDAGAKKLQGQKAFWRGVLCCFDRLMVRFDSDKNNFLSLGVPEEKIIVTGDCKVDAILARKADMDKNNPYPGLARSGAGDGICPLFIAGSTHAGEDEIMLEAFDRVRLTYPDARLIIAPRHPERALSVVASSLPYGEAALFTELERCAAAQASVPNWDVLVVNRIGVLLDLYSRVADEGGAAFVGGSLVPCGGQNPIEPALFGMQVTHGPDMGDFPDTKRMDGSGAAFEIRNTAELADAWLSAMNKDTRERTRENCKKYFTSVGGAGKRSWDIIEKVIFINNNMKRCRFLE